MQITIDTSAPLSETDMALLEVLRGREIPANMSVTKTKIMKTKAEPAEPKAEPVAAAEPVADTEASLETAMALATKAVAAGRTADVKAALASAGAKRVSELKGDAVSVFLRQLGS